jgi:hypothetical protein
MAWYATRAEWGGEIEFESTGVKCATSGRSMEHYLNV